MWLAHLDYSEESSLVRAYLRETGIPFMEVISFSTEEYPCPWVECEYLMLFGYDSVRRYIGPCQGCL